MGVIGILIIIFIFIYLGWLMVAAFSLFICDNEDRLGDFSTYAIIAVVTMGTMYGLSATGLMVI
jgi:hypothetical protein